MSGITHTQSQAVRSPHGTRLRTLLCVEDNPANLKLVEELIARRPDLRLLTAVNGTLGIELARASQPEMILMDVNLPDISGIEAMKILREDSVTAQIPIVALSANAMPRDIKKGPEAGFFRLKIRLARQQLMVAELLVDADWGLSGGGQGVHSGPV